MSKEPNHHLLLVDQDLEYLDWATKLLQAEGLKILRCDRADKTLKVLEKVPVDVVVCDIKLEPIDGIELIQRIRAHSPNTASILTAVSPTTTQIIEASQKGALDVLRKESLAFELRQVVESAFQSVDQKREMGPSSGEPPGLVGKATIIGVSRPLQNVMKVVGRVAQSDAPVLISGESGTGKELIARSIHAYSPRRKKEMLVINCGAIPENLLESELFGHEKGAFTGAIARRAGRFEDSHESTLFLDEVGDLPASVQVKLLRVLQDGTFSRVGSNEVLSTDVRIVTATNKDLAQEVREGRFREDLYYRLHVLPLHIASLNERAEDIMPLAERFAQVYAQQNGLPTPTITPDAAERLGAWGWPGNVRELENVIQRAVILGASDNGSPSITAEDLLFGPTSAARPDAVASDLHLEHPAFQEAIANESMADVERVAILSTLERTGGNKTEAARRLGVTARTLSNKMKIWRHAGLVA